MKFYSTPTNTKMPYGSKVSASYSTHYVYKGKDMYSSFHLCIEAWVAVKTIRSLSASVARFIHEEASCQVSVMFAITLQVISDANDD